jgi:hypothetical protein
MKFVIGGRDEGYSISQAPLSNPKEPWSISIWLRGKAIRTDRFETAKGAINYAHDRFRANAGMKPRSHTTDLKVHIKRR